MPALAAATTVPNIIIAERIAAKIKPAVFMCMPLARNTHDATAGYANKKPVALGDYAALTIRSSESDRLPLPCGVPWRTSVARPSFSSASISM